MFLSQPCSISYALLVQCFILVIVNPCLGATFNAKTQFSWVDSSCDSVIDRVNNAGDDYNALVAAAIANLEGGSPGTELGKGTLLSYFGTPVGQLINAKYGRLQSAFAAQPISLGLYCDGSAFTWETTYQEGPKKGQALPNGGQWHTLEGRYNPAEGPLYLSGTKTPQRTNICQTPTGQNAQGVSAIGGKHIILCPDAFSEPVLGAIPTTEQTIGTSLDTLTSTGAVLLHEASHCILSTTDTAFGYKIGGVLMTAKISSNAQKNADTWMYYAMASLASKNAWVVGLAQALDNFGPDAPRAPPSTGKRDAMALDVREPRAFAGNDAANFLAIPGFIYKRSGFGGFNGTGSTGAGVTGTGSTGTVSATGGSTTTGPSSADSTAQSSDGTGSTGAGIIGTGSTGTGSITGGSTITRPSSANSTAQGSTGTGSTGTGPAVSSSNTQSASSRVTSPNTNTASGFTTLKSNSESSATSTASGGYIGPVPISAEPASITAALVSESSVNVIGLTTFSGTTSPTPVTISSSVSSNGHTEKTNGVGPFPIFWSHTCWFCPPGLCLFCGIEIDLPPGIYPPGSIEPPPGFTGPLPTITIGNDGTPTYPEDEPPKETNNQPSNSVASQSSSAGPSSSTRTSSATVSSSSAISSSSGVNYIFETPALYSEVSDTVPFSSISALVASEFAANSINGDAGQSGTSAVATSVSARISQTVASSVRSQSSLPVSTTFSSSTQPSFATSTTPKPSITPTLATFVPSAFSCITNTSPEDPGYPCLCQGFDYCTSAGGGCGWTTVPAAENCCLDCE